MVEALTHLPECVRLAFVGEGPFQSELKTQARRLNVADRIHFAGSMPLTQLPGGMNALDVLVLPSRTTPRWKEQFGRVLIEAAACGIATVGSDSGAIHEVISEGGLVFPEGNAMELAWCLQLLMDEPDKRRHYGRAGQATALWPSRLRTGTGTVQLAASGPADANDLSGANRGDYHCARRSRTSLGMRSRHQMRF